jgi:hypothetical protein
MVISQQLYQTREGAFLSYYTSNACMRHSSWNMAGIDTTDRALIT